MCGEAAGFPNRRRIRTSHGRASPRQSGLIGRSYREDYRKHCRTPANGDRTGGLEDVYYDVETEEPQFGTVKEGLIARHLTFVPLTGVTIGPDNLQVAVTREQVKKAPNIGLIRSLPNRRVEPLPLLPAELHAARHRERPQAGTTMTNVAHLSHPVHRRRRDVAPQPTGVELGNGDTTAVPVSTVQRPCIPTRGGPTT